MIDNNILVRINDTIGFKHETYQEYFAALEIQNLFLRSENLFLNLNDNIWISSIELASDLFTSDQTLHFFNYLFIGTKIGIAKSLESFDVSDFNPTFSIACKIAYNLKEFHPEIFVKAEEYLNNYIVLWSYLYSQGKQPFEFLELIKAASTLSSEKLLLKLFLTPKYITLLFHSKEVDESGKETYEYLTYEKRIISTSKVFTENLSSFKTFFLLIPEINEKISTFYFSKSITTGFNYLKKYTFANIEFRQLKEAYDATKDIKILRQIGRTDIDFYIQNSPIGTDKNISSLYKFIIKNHIANSRGQDILFNSLFNGKLEMGVKCLIVEALSRPATLDKVLVYFQQCDASTKQYYRENIPETLNSIPFEILSPIFKS